MSIHAKKLSHSVTAALMGLALLVASQLAPTTVKVVQAQDTRPTLTPSAVASDTTLSVVVPTEVVAPGAAFVITVTINTNVPTTGAEVGLKFDPNLMEVTSVSEGTFYKSFAASKELETTFINADTPPDNANGVLKTIGIGLLGDRALGGPQGSGSLLIIQAKAKSGTGSAIVVVNKFKVTALTGVNDNGVPLIGIKLQNGSVGIGAAATQPTVEVVASKTPLPTGTPEPTVQPADTAVPSPTPAASETPATIVPTAAAAASNTPAPGATAAPLPTATSAASNVSIQSVQSPTPAPTDTPVPAAAAAAPVEQAAAATPTVETVANPSPEAQNPSIVANAEATAPPAAAAVPASDNTAPTAAANTAPGAAPTIAQRRATPTNRGNTSVGGGGQLPWEIIIPGAAVLVIGGVLALVLRRR